MVHRVAGFDLSDQLRNFVPGWVAKIVCALLGVTLSVILRAATNRVAPGVAPYAFVYPAVLLSTLLGGWQAGIGTLLLSGWLGWEFGVPRAAISGGQMHYQAAAAAIMVFTGLCVISVGQGFRIASRR